MSMTAKLSMILQTPRCLPALCWGDFGIGKTSVITALAEQLGWDFEIFRPGERGEGAMGVVPVPSEDRSVLHYPMPDWAARFLTHDRDALLFLDEASSVPPALQAPLMGLALDGMIAGKRLPERVRRIAVANPIDQAAGGWDMAPALANRFVHLEWKAPAASDWCAWLVGDAMRQQVTKLGLDDWDHQWLQVKALGAAFMRSHTTALHEDVSKCLGRTPPAYATPRTWEAALRLLASCRATGRMDLYPELALGCLGPGVAMEGAGAWLVWLKDNDLPDPEALLKDPQSLDHDPRRPDRTYATLLAVAEAGLAQSNGKKLKPEERGKRWNAAFEVLKRGLELKLGKDVILMPARQLTMSERAPKGAGVTVGPAVKGVCKVMSDLLVVSEAISKK